MCEGIGGEGLELLMDTGKLKGWPLRRKGVSWWSFSVDEAYSGGESTLERVDDTKYWGRSRGLFRIISYQI